MQNRGSDAGRNIWLIIAISSFIAIGLLISLMLYFRSYNPNYYPGYYGMMGGYGYAFFGFMWIIPTIFLIVILFIIFSFFRNEGGRREELSAEEILRKRLARGEIDRDEFEKRISALRENRRDR